MDVNQVQQATYVGQVGQPQPSPSPTYLGRVPQPPTAPVPSAATTASAPSYRPPSSTTTGSTVRRIFHIGPPSPSSSPSSSTFHSSIVRMIQEIDEPNDDQWVNVISPTHGDDGDDATEWIILDSGSDVSLLPTRFVADEGSDTQHALRDCQGGAHTVTGTRYTDLQVQDLSGEDVILLHHFVVGDVTTSLLSLGQLYQLGWRLHEAQDSEQLCLVDPSRRVEIPVHYRGKSFALRAHVRCVVEEEVGEDLTYEIRAVVKVYDEINEEARSKWSTTVTGTPFIKTVGSFYNDPRPQWGDRWPYRTTAIRKKEPNDPQWLIVEFSQKFMDKVSPFGRIEEISTELGGTSCEILTVLGAEEHGLEELGEDIEGDFWNVAAEREELQPGQQQRARGSQPEALQEGPPGLDLDLDMEAAQPPAAAEAVAVPTEGELQASVTLYEGFTLTRESTIRDLRAGCKWVGVSQSGSKSKMFDRIVHAHQLALKRAQVEVAMEHNTSRKSETHKWLKYQDNPMPVRQHSMKLPTFHIVPGVNIV